MKIIPSLHHKRDTSLKRDIMSKGTVKWFDATKGYGFITPEEGGKDLFVHLNSLEGNTQGLSEGQKVEYIEEEGRKGPEAKEVEAL